MSMFNWSGKQALGDDSDYSPSPVVGDRKTPVVGGDLEAFDHTFKGEIHTIAGDHDKLAVFGNCAYETRGIRIICTVQSFEVVEEVSISKVNKSLIPYKIVSISSKYLSIHLTLYDIDYCHHVGSFCLGGKARDVRQFRNLPHGQFSRVRERTTSPIR